MFDAPVFQAIPDRAIQSDLPVFVVGVPRSGTSLVEQILASHLGVVGVGERVDIQTAIKVLEKSGNPFVPLGWDPAIVSQEADAEVARLKALGAAPSASSTNCRATFFGSAIPCMMLPNAKIIVYAAETLAMSASPVISRDLATGLEWTNDLVSDRGTYSRGGSNDRPLARGFARPVLSKSNTKTSSEIWKPRAAASSIFWAWTGIPRAFSSTAPSAR